MYNQYLEVRSCKTGQGVFTKVEIPANTPIFEVTGNIYAEHELPDPNHPALLQVGPNVFIGPSGTFDDYINHSCNPNCWMHVAGNRAICFSLYVIPAGAELTFDYSTTATDTHDKWKMECACGHAKCRQVISGFQYLEPELQEEYKNKNLVPLYIKMPSMFQKR
jgi:SET domain-containing protein